MTQQRFRPVTFALGVLFGTFACVYLLGEITGLDVDAELAVSLAIVAAGTAAMVATVARAAFGGRTTVQAGEVESIVDPERQLDDAIDIDALLSDDWRSIEELVEDRAATGDDVAGREPKEPADGT